MIGDRATRDKDGYLYFVGRSDDVILSAGFVPNRCFRKYFCFKYHSWCMYLAKAIHIIMFVSDLVI